MGLKGRLRRVEREARSEGVILRLRDGGLRVFDQMEAWQEMFLTQTALMLGEARSSEVLDAVREATPESRAAFEEEHGSIEMVGHIIAADYQGGWVDEHRLLEDGTVEPPTTRAALRRLRGYGKKRGNEGPHPSPRASNLRKETVSIKDRLKRLEVANPKLCERRPCKGPITRSEERLLPDGTVEVSGERPAPLCDA